MGNSKIISQAIKKADKLFGKGVVRKLGNQETLDVGAISTGNSKLDHVLGIEGFPKGRITDLWGNPGSGKTSIALHAIANAQKEGKTAVFIDAEQAFSTEYAKALGVNTDKLILVQPDYGEQALEIVEHMLNTNAVDIIVIDSVPALVPKEELDGAMTDMQVGLQARMMSKALRKFTNKVKKTETALIFINQVRSTINSGWGKNEKATGGKALKFYSSVRVEVKRGKSIKEGNEIVGHELKLKTIKNKVAPPFREAKVHFIYGIGIDNTYDLIEQAIKNEVIIQNASWYYYENEDNAIGQGMSSVVDFVKENKDEIKEKLKE